MEKIYLVLSNGNVFEGYQFGADISSTAGELVFTTGMCGYIETLTDPSYAGQIVMQTFPLIGNYGIIEEDFEGECRIQGYVVREWCENPSNFRSMYTLDEFLKNNNVMGIYGVDTREITRVIRKNGVMNAMICKTLPEDISVISQYKIDKIVPAVTCAEKTLFPAEVNEKYKVTLIDYGAKKNIIEQLNKRGCTVTEVPSWTSAEEILADNPDGILLSNGPGDPAENVQCIDTIKQLLGKVPVFGICLGHQLLALANGAQTIKLKYGHRGANQPVRETNGKRTYITSQNHGYAVVSGSLMGKGEIMFVNANDGTCEGVAYKDKNAFSVQFYPEACSGPQDTSFLFDQFISMMGGANHAAV